jgi:recombination protein RecT
MSTDLDTLLRRDEDLYDFKGERERAQRAADVKPPPSVTAALDVFGAAAQPEDDPPQQELARESGGPVTGQEGGGEQGAAPTAAAAPPPEDPIVAARRQGFEARTMNVARKAIPGELRAPERSKEAAAWQVGWDNANNTKGGG